MTPFQWYNRAKAKVEQFLPNLDLELEVEVDQTSIAPYDGGDEYETSVLTFTHASNTHLSWTMEVEMNDEFIEQELEGVVRRIYFERVE